MTVFLEVEKVEDHTLLAPLQIVLDDTAFAEPLLEWKSKWEKLSAGEEKESTKERADRLISFLKWVVTAEDLLKAESAKHIEDVCHILFFFLDDFLTDDYPDIKEELFESMAKFLCSSAS